MAKRGAAAVGRASRAAPAPRTASALAPARAEAEHVDRPGARPDSRRPCAPPRRDARPRARPPRAASPERELRRQRRGVRAARAVRGAVGVALARGSRRARSPSKKHVDRLLAVAAGDDDRARAEREHRARQRLGPSRSRRRRRRAARAPRGRSASARSRAAGSARPARACGILVEQPRARLGDHHRIDAPPACRRAARRAPRRPPRSLAASPSIPTLTASTPMSASTARTCARIIFGGPASTRRTATVFCAVIAVIAVVPCTPQRAKAFRSAWIPAPPPESEPAIVRQTGCGGRARARRRRIGGRGQAIARKATAETAVGVLSSGIARQEDLFVRREPRGRRGRHNWLRRRPRQRRALRAAFDAARRAAAAAPLRSATRAPPPPPRVRTASPPGSRVNTA